MTSSVQPPVLDPPIGTPSNEWAKKTASSFEPPKNATSEQPIGQSPGVTPGNELPGAFPNRDQGETSTGTTNITDTIVDTAKQYLPTSVMSKVETFLGNNSGTDQQVRASEHDVYHKQSLPSQELRGALPHERVGGAGSLPGASIEKSVALLPDEQADWSEWKTFAGRNTPGYQTPSNLKANPPGLTQTAMTKATSLGVAAGVIKPDVPQEPKSENPDKADPSQKLGSDDAGEGHPTSREVAEAQQALGNVKPLAFDVKPAQDVSMPSTETQGQQPGESTGGVGSLPGSKDEQGVARLPEERETKTSETDTAKKDSGAMGAGVVGATDPLKKETQSREPPTETEPVPSEQQTTRSEPGDQSTALRESDNLGGVQRSAGSEGSNEAQHKATLKEKISGGMKVMSGKLGHDKSKVEEGKKLMHGQGA